MYMTRDISIDEGSKKTNRGAKCEHANAEWLGSDSGMVFFRCLTCRRVIVNQGRTSLAVPLVRTGDSPVASA
jgi:hypothetical protein